MIHQDAIPFLILLVLSVVAGVIGRQKGAITGLVLFCLAGSLAIFAYVSNSARWPVPFGLELIGLYGSLPLIISGIVLVFTKKLVSGIRAVAFGVVSAAALCVSGYIALMVFGLSRL
jgi:hypothetical protein